MPSDSHSTTFPSEVDRDEFNEATANVIHLYNFTSFVGDTVNKGDFPTQVCSVQH